MKHKDYKKLMETPFDELSDEDQKKRKKEFHRRLEVAQMFITGMIKGHVNDDIGKLMDDDDPLKDAVELLKLKINEVEGVA
tara:strand:- start:1280 stop:1522 length:243 start_codon:yes stop_codon:yes gene_type:complete